MIPNYSEIEVVTDVPRYGLKSGAIGTVVDVNTSGGAYEVEFNDLPDGAVTATLLPDEIRLAQKP